MKGNRNAYLLSLQEAIEQLTKGEAVALPTETVYGLASNGLDEKSIQKVFTLKGRPSNNPLILHISSSKQIEKFCTLNKEKSLVHFLANQFWPGPLTLVLKKKNRVPNIATGGKDTVAVRCPSHPVFQEILSSLPFPLVAPSANPFQRTSPT